MIGENIRKFRKANNMSQDELAEKLEVTRQSVSLWENEQTQPSLDNIIALSRIFNVPTDSLLTSVGNETIMPAEIKEEQHKSGKSKKKIIIIIVSVLSAVILAVAAYIVCRNSLPGNVSNSTEKTNIQNGSKSSNPKNKREIKKEDKNEETTGASENKEVKDEKNDTKKSAETAASTETVTSTQSTDNTPSTQKSAESQAPKAPASSAAPQEKVTAAVQTPVEAPKDLYGYFKNFVVTNGVLNGDYSYYTNTSDKYGGLASEDFSLYYWGDTDTVEFCLHSVLDETFSVNFYIRIPKTYNGTYEYISSYYYRSDGYPYCEAKGTITASEFTSSYPLNCTNYSGPSDIQNDFMEMSRVGICDALRCLKNFLEVEKMQYKFSDLGFKKFS